MVCGGGVCDAGDVVLRGGEVVEGGGEVVVAVVDMVVGGDERLLRCEELAVLLLDGLG